MQEWIDRLAAIPGGADSLSWRPEPNAVPSLEYLMKMMPGQTDGKYLSFTVLVQNRRKNRKPMVVVGKAIMGVCTAEGSPIIQQGKESWEPNLALEFPNL
jgi:hypothetical protein